MPRQFCRWHEVGVARNQHDAIDQGDVRGDEWRSHSVSNEIVAIEEEAQVNAHRDASISAAQMKSPWFGDL